MPSQKPPQRPLYRRKKSQRLRLLLKPPLFSAKRWKRPPLPFSLEEQAPQAFDALELAPPAAEIAEPEAAAAPALPPEEVTAPAPAAEAAPGFSETLEAPPLAFSLPEEAPTKKIGDLQISLPLYNVYLTEAEEWSRKLSDSLRAWQANLEQPQPEGVFAWPTRWPAAQRRLVLRRCPTWRAA